MINQGNSYLSKNITLNNSRFNEKTNRLGDRTITSNIIDGKRYFSAIDAEIYFGGINNTFIDEIVQITWTLEQATLPIYGYNSYVFDDLVIGSRQVTGSFSINFTKSNFLYDVLRNCESVNRASFYTNETSNTSLDLSNIFKLEHNASWNKSFNIVIGYGDYKQGGTNTTMILLYCVQLTGCQQILSADGQPIGETYTFIAKDIRYELNGNKNNASSSYNENSTSDESFIFNINYFNLTIKNNISKLSINYSFANGTIVSVSISLKDHNKKDMYNAAFNIQVSSLKSYELDSVKTEIIKKEIAIQKSENIIDKYLYADFIIQYKNDNNETLYYTLTNQRVSIIE